MTFIEFHGYGIARDKVKYFYMDKIENRWGITIILDGESAIFILESANAPPYDEAKTLYEDFLRLIRESA